MKKVIVVLILFCTLFSTSFFGLYQEKNAYATQTYTGNCSEFGFDVYYKQNGNDNIWPMKDKMLITVTSQSNIRVRVECFFKQGSTTGTILTAETSNLTTSFSYTFVSQWTNASDCYVRMWFWTYNKEFKDLTDAEKAVIKKYVLIPQNHFTF